MKKRICLLACLMLIFSLTLEGICGCSSIKPGQNQPSGVNDVIEQSMAESESKDEIDVDLTVLSSTMVYSEVYNMLVSPESYIGKTVRMKGLLAYFHDESTGNDYFSCIIRDAAACCAQGIEFVLTEDYVYPDDYPEEDEEICVVGVFDTYQEGGYTYCTLRDAVLQQVK